MGKRGLMDAERRQRLNPHRACAQGANEAGVVAHNEVMSTRRAKRRAEARARSHNDVIIGKAVSHAE
jgi:hypothetical protein